MGKVGRHLAPRPHSRKPRTFGRALPLALAMVLVTAGLALADNVINDVTVGGNDTFTLGGSTTVAYWIVATGGGCNADDGTDATVVINTPAQVTATPSSLVFTKCGPDFKQNVVFTATAAGEYAITVGVSDAGSGTYNTTPGGFTLHVVAPVVTNTPPSAPGKPAATPASPSKGGFTLNWDASTDDGLPNPPGALTYELQGKDADDPDFSVVSSASALTTNSYTFASEQPAEGTWTYRVRASDSALTSDWSATSDSIVVDRTKPTFGACPTAGPFIVGGGPQSVGPISASDPDLPDGSLGSGINAAASMLSGEVDTSTVGTKQVTFTAVDNAGNSDTKQCSYSVQYGFVGFERPVENPSVMNVAKAGQAIPLKFRVVDASEGGISTLTSVSVTVQSLSCAVGSTTDEVEEYAAGSSGLQNLGDGFYQFNWKTPMNYASSCKTMRLDLGDGVHRTALFQFRK